MYSLISFVANSDQLSLLFQMSDTQTVYVTTNAVFRDPSAWYHIVIRFDSTQSNQANRLFIYVNGAAITFSAVSPYLAYPNQNQYTGINSATQHNLSNLIISGYGPYSEWFDGYMAEVNFIDGQALTPSSFGSINATTGVWQPARYTGSYGTNGFYLKFNNGTSTTTLGNDSSGNGNNWTTNNISLTAGSTYDWMIDSPTSYAGSSYGVGNYAVLNPLGKGSGVTLSNANLTWSITLNNSVAGSIGMSSGKWYWEVVAGSNTYEGIVLNTASLQNQLAGIVGGYCYSPGGNKYAAGNIPPYAAYGATYTSGDIIGVTFDADVGTLTFYKNNVSQGVAYSGIVSGIYFPAVGSDSVSTATGSINFGQLPFNYTPPSGYKSLCTQNLPAPAIYNGANHMAATTYTGNGATQSISNAVNGVSFQPDLVWIKKRDTSGQDHVLQDSVRGFLSSTKLSSSSTAAENNTGGGATDPQWGYVSSVSSSGINITVGSGAGDQVNKTSGTYIGWQWKAGGTAVTNTAGSITSQVSANPTAGFSVVTYTGTGANATVGHGLGVAPSFIIGKRRNSTGNWQVYASAISNMQAGFIVLNATDAFRTVSSAVWGNTQPTSSVFTIGTDTDLNTNGSTNVAYCFAAIAGYSAFGSYTGNGSSVGPFIYTGFLPRFILIKSTSGPRDWIIWDTARNPYNIGTAGVLFPDTSGAEYSGGGAYAVSVVSNGFYLPVSTTNLNASGETMIYAAFASNPFQNSLAF